MATKREETAEGATGCLARAGDDEPLFILRARDQLAPGVVRAWAHYAEQAGVDKEKVGEAIALAREMELWQEANSKRLPD